MKRYIVTTLMLMFAAVSTAQAQDLKFYAGVGVGAFGLEYDEPGVVTQNNVTFGGFVKAGADINEYIGAEVRFGMTGEGSSGYPVGFAGSPVPFEFSTRADYFISYFLKLQFPLAEDFRVYALAGGTTAKVTGQFEALAVLPFAMSASATKTGFSYGAGAEYFVSDQLSVGAEWVPYWTNVSIGAGTKMTIWGITGSVNYFF